MDAATSQQPMFVKPRRAHVTHAWMTDFVYAELEAEARRRLLHPDALAARILEKVLLIGLADDLLGR